MIITNKECTGCTACVNTCPVNAITCVQDHNGLFKVSCDESKCVHCGLCENVCHLNRKALPEAFFYAAASKDKDNIMKSSSGGIFYEICKYMYEEDGVVYGAVQTEAFKVEHKRADTLEGAKQFRKSKHFQSDISNCYPDVKNDLEKGKKVLFSGVGCQIAGLYSYLQKKYKNLYTCEVVCHGITSSKPYEKYIRDCQEGRIIGIDFRDKRYGWLKNSFCETYTNGKQKILDSATHPVHKLYLKGINMREGCGNCVYQKLPRQADITLADFWLYKGRLYEDNKETGISLVVTNNDKGNEIFEAIKKNIYWEEVEDKTALKSCRHLNNSPILHNSQRAFWKLLDSKPFDFIYKLFSEFGDIILSDELEQVQNLDGNYIKSIIREKKQDIIYYNPDGVVKGIVTYGQFEREYGTSDEWVNVQYKFLRWDNLSLDQIREIFEQNTKINRIPILDNEGGLLFEIRR